MAGLKMASPRLTARIAKYHLFFVGVFEYVPARPGPSAANTESSSSKSVTTRIRTLGLSCRILSRGLYAVYLGHLKIHQDHVWLQLRGARDGLLARAASPTTSNSGTEESRATMPFRNSG